MIDVSVVRNLDTQHRRLEEIERAAAELLAGDTCTDLSEIEAPPDGRAETYDELTARNEALRAQRQWADIDLDSALGTEQHALFEEWRARQRLPWAPSDLAAVGIAGLIGVAATVYDTAIDQRVRDQLLRLKETHAFRDFEKAGKDLAIDYMGPGFGGPAHRVRSPGHDLARPLAALRQIRAGHFEGIEWVDGVRRTVRVAHGRPVESLPEALMLWAKHLAADLVTTTSLPLPGWTLLYELPWRDARKLAHDIYKGTQCGDGWNTRSGLLTPTLPVITTEVLIRTHIHTASWARTGTPSLDRAHQALRDELLLAAHGLVSAAAVTKTVALAMAGPGGALALTSPNLLALRHLNLPAMLRTGALGLQVLKDHSERRQSAAPSWDSLLDGTNDRSSIPEASG